MLGKFGRMIGVSRPVFWLIAPAAYLFGAISSGSAITQAALFQAFLLSFPLGVYVFGINDLFDTETDGANPRRRGWLWGAKVVKEDASWIYPSSLMVAAAMLASSANPIQALVIAIFLPIPLIYSMPPLRLKSRPVLDSISNAAYTYGPYAMGFSMSGGLGFLNPQMILFALVFSAAHAIGTVMDMEGDRRAGIRTFAIAYGPRAAALFATAVLLANLPFLWGAMKSMFAVILVYLLSSLWVLLRPGPEAAKSAFLAMNIALAAWMAYAFCGYASGLWEAA